MVSCVSLVVFTLLVIDVETSVSIFCIDGSHVTVSVMSDDDSESDVEYTVVLSAGALESVSVSGGVVENSLGSIPISLEAVIVLVVDVGIAVDVIDVAPSDAAVSVSIVDVPVIEVGISVVLVA
jgi:hypothetical protein